MTKNKLFKHHAASIRWPFAGFSGLWRRHIMRFMLTRGESCPGLPQLFRRRELARFCLIARGSASELEYQILLAHDLKLIPSGRYEELSQEITEIKRMLTVLVHKLTADRSPETCLGERSAVSFWTNTVSMRLISVIS